MWGTILASVLGLTATILTWYFKKKETDPYKDRLKQSHSNYGQLLAKYAQVIKERNELRELAKDMERQLYEGYSLDDLIDNANRMPKFEDDGSN